MDVLRKELNSIYAGQRLDLELLAESVVQEYVAFSRAWCSASQCCSVITDAARDRAFLFAGSLGRLLGLDCDFAELSSSDEDCIYTRLHPEDLVDKRMLEFEFFKFVDALGEDEKLNFKATCRLRMLDAADNYVIVDNSTQIMRLSPAGKIWLILCRYDYSPVQSVRPGIDGKIVNVVTGEVREQKSAGNRANILSVREKEILRLIKLGKLSKEIADSLQISINTVNRHRQNILAKLSVNNSLEAVNAAEAMKLL